MSSSRLSSRSGAATHATLSSSPVQTSASFPFTSNNAKKHPSQQYSSTLTYASLTAIIHYLPCNGAVYNVSSAVSTSVHRGESAATADGLPSGELFVSAEELLLRAAQPPSATLSSPLSNGTAATYAESRAIATRPLALLAASAQCRRALEEHVVGGCVLTPQRSLILQVRRREVLQPAAAALASSSQQGCYLTPSTTHKEGKREGGHRKHRGEASRPRTRSPSAFAATRVVAEASQQLVVTSVNVQVSALPFQRVPSQSPTRSPAQRPQSARVGPLRSPRHVLVGSPLPPLTLTPQEAPHPPPPPPPLSTTSTTPTQQTRPRLSASSAGQPRHSLSKSVDLSSLHSAPVISVATASATRSPVLLSRRAPVTALVKKSPTTTAAAAAAPSPPSVLPTPPLANPSTGARAVSATAGQRGDNDTHETRTREGGSSGGGNLSPPLRPTQFPSLSPRMLLPPATANTAMTCVRASSSHTSASSPPSSPATSSVPLLTSPALRALYYALWWVKRGPLPVALSLLHYSEADLHALWQVLREDGEGENEGEEEPLTRNLASPSQLFEDEKRQCGGDQFGQMAPNDERGNGSSSSLPMPPPSRAPAAAATATPPSPQRNLSSVRSPRRGTDGVVALPSPVTELYVHGRAANAAVAAFLPAHPEVRALRLTHATLSETQLHDLARYCPDVTQLSLAMNAELRGTSFLCPTPSETSSVATTATTTATTIATTVLTAAPPQLPIPPSPLCDTHAPRFSSSTLRTFQTERPPLPQHQQPSPQQRRSVEEAAAPNVSTATVASTTVETSLNGRRGGLPQPPPLESLTQRRSSRSPPLADAPVIFENADRGGHDNTTASAAGVRAMDGEDENDAVADSVRGTVPSSCSDAADGTVHSRSTQPPPLLPATGSVTPALPQQQQHAYAASPRQPSYDVLQNSQLDLFAAEEEGEAEMRLSLWQAAQTDAAERRQAVFILRPSDVTLGDSAGSTKREGHVRPGTTHPALNFTPVPPHTGNEAAAVAAAASRTTKAEISVGHSLLSPLRLVSSPRGDDVDGGSTATANFTDATAPRLRSVSTSTQHTDPVRASAPPPETSIEAALTDTRDALPSTTSPPLIPPSAAATVICCAEQARFKESVGSVDVKKKEKHRHGDAKTSSVLSSSSSALRTRPRRHTHWADTLMDLDLSYTHVRNEDAARDVPRLRALRRLSLEGCLHLTHVRWLPEVANLRELNLSFSSVQGAALFPLGRCRQLTWLKLEGCASFTSVDQLWCDPTVTGTSGATDTQVGVATSNTSAAARTTAAVVRHQTRGGIPAITVLPPALNTAAPTTGVGAADADNEDQHRGGEARVDARRQTGDVSSHTSPTSPAQLSPSISTFDAAAAATVDSVPLLNSLRTLIATSTGLTDAGLQSLPLLASLECLFLNGCAGVSNVNVAAQLASLQALDASRTAVTTDGLAALRHSRTLQLLRLQECLALTQLPSFFLESNRSRTSAGLQTGVGAACRVGRSRSALPAGTVLRVLDVSSCTNLVSGGVDGLVADSLSMQLRDAATAAAAGDARGNNETRPRATQLGAVASADSTNNASSLRASMAAPAVFPQLRHLILRSCDAVAQLYSLRCFPHVVELDLYHTNVDDATLTAALASWRCLEVLNVASTKVCTLAAWNEPAASAICGKDSEHKSAETLHAQRSDRDGLRGQSRLPAFAATLRVLILSNTEVTSAGLAVLRCFPRLEVLQLSNCHLLTSLDFLPLLENRNTKGGAGKRRTALRELTVTEAADLVNEQAFPYLAMCPGLRTLSLVGCTQLGSGGQAWSASPPFLPLISSTAVTPSSTSQRASSHSPASAAPAKPILKSKGAVGVSVLRGMVGLVDLNLSRTAVAQSDLRGLFVESVNDGNSGGGLHHSPAGVNAARASARLNLLSSSTGTSGAVSGPAAAVAAAATSASTAPSASLTATASSESNTIREMQAGSTSAAPLTRSRSSLQRLWLRGCRYLNEEDLLAAAETGCTDDGDRDEHAMRALASIREVYLSHGRYGSAVLSSLLL